MPSALTACPCCPIDGLLSTVTRRYRIPAIPDPALSATSSTANPATALALIIDQARNATAQGLRPDSALQDVFTDRLARLIQDALRPMHGDSAFQAMVLRQRDPGVREYASLSAHAERDRRAVLTMVNAIAHPGKQQRLAPGPLRETLAQLQARAEAGCWTVLADLARVALRPSPSGPALAEEAAIEAGLEKLLQGPALQRLQRRADLAAGDSVRRYEALWDRQGPRSGSAEALALGKTTQRRGAAVEALAAQALQGWARRLGEAQGGATAYRVVTSMRVPASLAANADRAKTEWDVVLLRRAGGEDGPPEVENSARQRNHGAQARTAHEGAGSDGCWDICLVAEVKSSVDAATTDYPRLLRGLRLLAQADGAARYSFACQQGVIEVRGASLRALPTDDDRVAGAVLYCCDAALDDSPRLLNAASRMQLLSAPESLAYATHVQSAASLENTALDPTTGPDPKALAPVWHKLLSSPQWQPVLQQYATLHQVRELMVHVADLDCAVAEPNPLVSGKS
ncbi:MULTISPECIES: 3-deoxy-D-arabino-heptulosonate 7-phosphate synthase [unclassified Achromobacter]|uniref:3-deoxy-D-arabino-heptulosonate 7-phosphate synthase n=1 Tax=unclassified Achromobacter TaxID=2626865 RepID=UPI000B518888|nr:MULTISPECIES: 3-deoxy-D-arabino-heptulosonate 7-phosphate synthase [unclassified Achromobacter]OWT80821.1 3-deoxy-D-arabino-heptulosonate 7-phosphate synthase [Achromobacter sp. HZ34]OWT81337.1 3-deoxy-D-arabino-heptulosonate 7-phosphate synthase [Achromobacter sp. HZ28]